MDGGAPANGTYDFEFSLYNAISGGTQVGSTLSMTGVTVPTACSRSSWISAMSSMVRLCTCK